MPTAPTPAPPKVSPFAAFPAPADSPAKPVPPVDANDAKALGEDALEPASLPEQAHVHANVSQGEGCRGRRGEAVCHLVIAASASMQRLRLALSEHYSAMNYSAAYAGGGASTCRARGAGQV